MRNKNALLGGLLSFAIIAGISFAADPHGAHNHKGHGDDPVLPTGSYVAKVGALVCDGCPSLLQKTMLGIPGINSASIDSKTSEVRFSVKEKASVKWSALQKALRASANKMGMGADFTLSEFRIEDQEVKAAEAKDKMLTSGYYTAKVAAIMCGACGPEIEKTMRGIPGVGAAQVDSNNSTVRFAVLAGKKVQVSDLQKALKESAERMGLGADYTLSEVQPLKKG